MPRIDPIQLLNCLSVLLSPSGGIKSREEVQRLASLMTKFSKKLVSKCIYIQILKCTETELLGLFMGSGGWLLAHIWLTESIVAKNWPLVRELLELLLLCPVDIERLKTNNCPKLVKELSKDGNQLDIRALASKLVEQWLKTVKGEQVIPLQVTELPKILLDANNLINDAIKTEIIDANIAENNVEIENKIQNDIKKEAPEIKKEIESSDEQVDCEKQNILPVLKISLKDGKNVISKVKEEEIDKSLEGSETDAKEHHRSKSKDKSREKSSSKSSSSSKHSSKSPSSEKHKSSSSSSHSSSSGHKSSSSSRRSSKDESRDKDKDKHSSRSKSDSKSKKSSDRSSSSSSKSKEERSKPSSDKDKNKEKVEKNDKPKEKSSDDKSQSPSIHKLGKIPKLSDAKKEKPSISIEVRKPDEPKPKTVKTFHSRFRKHGLEEEVKPPPSRAAVLSNKKPPPVLPPSIPIPKRPSPVHNEPPPEKKPKIIETIDKPGAIKLIPPKPKPMLLLESDMFMDALNASATNKKEPKKRKRRTSGSKDGNTNSDGSPPHTPTALNSPTSENKSVPPRFYQDTLETEENKEKSESSSDKNENSEADAENTSEVVEATPHTLTINGLKGVLCYHKRKGPKKSIKWKPDTELEEIQYFELDETERVNVTKTSFTDMKHLDRINEREAFQKARNVSTDDVMEEKTSWKALIPIDLDGQIQVDYGKNSKEKDIQAIRQKGTLQPLYFHKSMIPDSPLEPEIETHTYSEPQTIPLEDVTGNQDNVSDFRTMPWPEPKGNAPPAGTVNMPTMFPANMTQYPNGFPNPQFPVVPGFPGPNMVPTDWQNGMPPAMLASLSGAMAQGVMPPGPLPPGAMPGMMMPTDGMMMGAEMFGAPNPMFPMGIPPDGFNMQQNMFPMDFNMAAAGTGPMGPDGSGFGGPNNFRGAMRGRGAGGSGGGHWRGKQPTNWDNSQRGRGGGPRGGRKTPCIYFSRKGSCRQGDNCTFLHPGVNGPY